MHHRELNEGQTGQWMCLAVIPALHFAGSGYAAAGIALGALALTRLGEDGWEHLSRTGAAVQWIWMGLVLAALLPGAGAYWPGEKAELAVAVTLVILAGLAAHPAWAARAGSTLFWVELLALAAIGLGAAGIVEWERMKPEWNLPRGELVVMLLVPALSGLWAKKADDRSRGIIAGVLLAAAVGIQGILGEGVRSATAAPMYELGRRMENPGFEILIAVAMTLGWYGLCSMLIQGMTEMAKRMGIGERAARWGSVSAALGLIGLGWRMDGTVMAAGCGALWIGVPMIRNWAQKIKMKKGEKSS